jgi:hypothetical protein
MKMSVITRTVTGTVQTRRRTMKAVRAATLAASVPAPPRRDHGTCFREG